MSSHKNLEERRAYHRARDRKQRGEYRVKVVGMFGGKCQTCGYNENLQALQLDHIVPLLRKKQRMSNPDIEDTKWLDELVWNLVHTTSPSTTKRGVMYYDTLAQIQAKFKENYKRLAMELEDEPELTEAEAYKTGQILYEYNRNVRVRNQLRKELRNKLNDQLNNMKGE